MQKHVSVRQNSLIEKEKKNTFVQVVNGIRTRAHGDTGMCVCV